MLRDYQQRAIDQLYSWFSVNDDGHPCLVLPTGSGKSHIIAALCKDAVKTYSGTRILMLTHVKELIEQNAEKMRQHWPNAPLGVYSAGLRSREMDQITFGGIQSLCGRAEQIGKIDLVIIDECHLINTKQQGGYRDLLRDLGGINPWLRIVGLTATPYRLGQGLLTEGDDAIFTDIIEPVGISELVEKGYLATLKSKHTYSYIDTDSLHKRAGEYVAKDMQQAAELVIESAIGETIARAGDRKHWLFFCPGVENAQHAADILNSNGISAACLTGKNTKAQREFILDEFTSGRIQALTNANILTTGFDYPDIDLIAMLRPTLSPSLYMQMVGRGMRLKSHTDHCLVLDFSGNVERHGPITKVSPPNAKGDGGEAQIKVCPECFEQVSNFVKVCPECGFEFVVEDGSKKYRLSDADIMGTTPPEMPVTDWKWAKHVSRSSGKEMIKVRYYGNLGDPIVTEYFPITHGGVVERKAYTTLDYIRRQSKAIGKPEGEDMMNAIAEWLNQAEPPSVIKYEKNGKFFEVKERLWTTSNSTQS